MCVQSDIISSKQAQHSEFAERLRREPLGDGRLGHEVSGAAVNKAVRYMWWKMEISQRATCNVWLIWAHARVIDQRTPTISITILYCTVPIEIGTKMAVVASNSCSEHGIFRRKQRTRVL